MIIGLTGSIATGKSTVTGYLLEKGYPVIDSDKLARRVVEKGHPVLDKIKERFGEGVILPSGELNRKALGSIIFTDEGARKDLNAITHPAINAEMHKKITEYEHKGHQVIFCDIPLLYEGNLTESFDAIWVVYVSEATQLERLIARDSMTMAEAKDRIASQLSIEDKKEMADQVIWNEGSKAETFKQIDGLLNQLT